MPLTIKTSQTIEQEINIPVPSFWKRKDDVEWTAIIDEATAITFYCSKRLTAIRHSDPEMLNDDIMNAYHGYDICDEQEWLDKYAEVLKSISLAPVLTVGKLQDERYEILRNSITH